MLRTVVFQRERGDPTPLGASKKGEYFNFALFSQHAANVTLCLFNPGNKAPFQEISLDPKINRTGFVWHIAVRNLPETFDYGYRLAGPKEQLYNEALIVTDPYAKSLNTSQKWGDQFYASNQVLGEWFAPTPFDWQGTSSPNIPMQELVIYEMHVRGFTISSGEPHSGTYLGLIDKIPYLKKLGVNTIELLPIFEFNECENALKNPNTGKTLWNYWGYSTINFFSPMNRYTSSPQRNAAIEEFKTMVREMHKNQIEVILDVVYNHTAEGNEKGPTYSFRGIDNSVYYMLGQDGHYLNFTGCGNTFNCNHTVVAKFILDSLRYWVSEMHVDGFRFDLASILTRDVHGNPTGNPPIVEAISKDPILANCKLIAEAWDAAGLYQVGSFPAYGKWAEWNGKFRDVTRKFIKGTDGVAGDFSRALSGSQDLYASSGRKPYHSVNFVTAHDGFSLRDLVSYTNKHNHSNGEDNRDGTNDNESWNCGQEGDTTNPKILQFRQRQMRNFITALMVSLGTPMILMGDEYQHTRRGNNNTWSHDDELNWFLWDELEKQQDFFRFYSLIIAFRKKQKLLRRATFLEIQDVDWHGHMPFHANWSANSRFVAYTLKDHEKEEHLYIAFNSESGRPSVQLPDPPANKKWYRIVDTALAPPNDFIEEPLKFAPIQVSYKMEAYSVLIAQSLA